MRFCNSQSLLSFERVLTRVLRDERGRRRAGSTCIRSVPLISYIREALPWCSRPSSQGSSSWKTGVSAKKKTTDNSGFHLAYQVSRLRGLVLPFRRCLPALEGASGPRPPASECRKPCGGSLSFRVVSMDHWRSGLPLFLGSGSLPRRPLSGALGLLSVGWRLGGVPPVLVAVFPLSQSEVCRPQGQPS